MKARFSPVAIFELAAVGASIFATGLFLAVAVLRLSYPFQLEWLEGESLHYVARILAGESLYPPPSLDFVPFLYTPLYFYVSALAAKFAGLGLPALRLVSLLAAVGTLALIFEAVRRETGRLVPALLAAGLFAATYRLGGAFLDLARVDSLFLLLVFGALFAAGFGRRASSAVLAGALAAAAWQTKQLAAVAVLPVILYLVWSDRRRGLLMAGTAALVAGASVAVLVLVHGPWYRFYIYDLPGSHVLGLRQLFTFWPLDIAASLPIALVLTLLYLTWPVTPGRRGFHGAAALGLVATAWLGRMNPGGYDNVVMPAFGALAVGFGLGAHRAAAILRELPDRNLRSRGLVLLHVALLVQIAALTYDPRLLLPSAEDRAAGEQLVERIRRIDGPVFLPEHGYLSLLAGKPAHAHRMAIQDTVGDFSAVPPPHGEQLLAELLAALESHRFAAIALGDPHWLLDEVREHYRPVGPVFDREELFWPPTGHRYRPWLWFEPHERGKEGDAPVYTPAHQPEREPRTR